MRKRMDLDNVVALVLIIGALLCIGVLSRLPKTTMRTIGAGVWPMILCAGIVALGSSVLFTGLRSAESDGRPSMSKREGVVVASVLVIGIILTYALDYVGTVVVLILAVAGVVYAMGVRRARTVALNAIVATLLITTVFGRVLNVQLPRGISIFRTLSYFLW